MGEVIFVLVVYFGGYIAVAWWFGAFAEVSPPAGDLTIGPADEVEVVPRLSPVGDVVTDDQVPHYWLRDHRWYDDWLASRKAPPSDDEPLPDLLHSMRDLEPVE